MCHLEQLGFVASWSALGLWADDRADGWIWCAVFCVGVQESNMNAGVGVDGLMSAGKLDQVRNGPLFWVRTASS